jgi:hypothetical protein
MCFGKRLECFSLNFRQTKTLSKQAKRDSAFFELRLHIISVLGLEFPDVV